MLTRTHVLMCTDAMMHHVEMCTDAYRESVLMCTDADKESCTDVYCCIPSPFAGYCKKGDTLVLTCCCYSACRDTLVLTCCCYSACRDTLVLTCCCYSACRDTLVLTCCCYSACRVPKPNTDYWKMSVLESIWPHQNARQHRRMCILLLR